MSCLQWNLEAGCVFEFGFVLLLHARQWKLQRRPQMRCTRNELIIVKRSYTPKSKSRQMQISAPTAAAGWMQQVKHLLTASPMECTYPQKFASHPDLSNPSPPVAAALHFTRS